MIFKIAIRILFALTLGLGMGGTAFAIPVTYTIEGTVGYIYQRPGYNYITNAQSMSVGDTLRYVIEVDLDSPGTIEKYNASDGTQGIYAHYITGDALPLHPSVSFSNGDVTEHNYMLTSGSVSFQSKYNLLRIDGGPYAEWDVGQTFTWGYNYYYDFAYSDVAYAGYLRSTDLKVIAKSSSTSVPDASIAFLLGPSLILLGIIGRRKSWI